MNVISPAHTDGAFSIQLARAFTRIKYVFMTMRSKLNMDAGLSEVNDFWHPHGYHDNYQPNKDTLEWQMQVGSTTMPTYPIRSLAESYYQLEKCMGNYASIDGMSILADEYRSNKYVLGYDTERAATGPGGGGSFSGMSTRGGEVIRLEVKHINADSADQAPNRVYVTLHHDVLVNIRLEGVEVLD